MRIPLSIAITFTIVFSSFLLAQVQKREPEERRIELSPSAFAQPDGVQSPLPKIELPEFVITGIASIDLPDVEKVLGAEMDPWVDLSMYARTGTRERATHELEDREKEEFMNTGGATRNGRLSAGIGNFFSPRVDARFGATDLNSHYRLRGDYFRTKGYAPNTDRSGGELSAFGGIAIPHSSVHRSRLDGRAAFSSESYRFFGSASPSAMRTLDRVDVGASYSSPATHPLVWRGEVGIRRDAIADTTATTRENRIDARMEGEFSLGRMSIVGGVRFAQAVRSVSASGTVAFLDMYLSTSRIWWNDVLLKAGAHYYEARGDGNQKLSRLYPDATLGYRFGASHTVFVRYRGEVEFASLALSMQQNPYLSASSALRHPDVLRAVGGGIESEWSEALRTRVEVEHRTIVDLPLYVDFFGVGLWHTAYVGRATILDVRGEAVANVSPNDYFSASVRAYDAMNDATRLRIPYIPEFEASVGYGRSFAFGLDVTASLGYVHRQETSVSGSNKLPGYLLSGLRLAFVPVEQITVFVEAKNLTDKRYQRWKGYTEAPFTLFGGVSFCW